MGVEAGSAEKKVAFVKCKGTCDKATVKYNYYGIDDATRSQMQFRAAAPRDVTTDASVPEAV